MNEEKLFEAMGNISDDLLENRKKSPKKWLIPAVAAACLALVAAVGLGALHSLTQTKKPLIGSSRPVASESYVVEVAPDIGDVSIYYCAEDGTTQMIKKEITLTVDDVFAAWKEANGIGDEVTMERTHYLDNGKEEMTASVAMYTVPTYFEYGYTLSSEMGIYLTRSNYRTTLESLEQTLYEFLIGDKSGVVEIAVEESSH